MYSTIIDVCFMCINDNSCTDVNENVLTLVEYILPEITIIKLGVTLRICSVCEETIRLFSKFKGICLENSLLLETSIKEAQCYKATADKGNTNEVNDATSIANDEPVDEIDLKTETPPAATLHETKDLVNDENIDKTDAVDLQDISITEDVLEENNDENCIKKYKQNTPKKSFSCRICKKIYKKKISLKFHMLIHKECTCVVCKKEFANKYILKQHMALHDGDKQYQCYKCDKKFTQKGSLKRHMSSHVRTQKIKENKTIYFKCCICKKYSSHNYHNKLHKDFKHEPVVRKSIAECPKCKKRISGNYLKEHMKKHEGLKQYKCNFCAKSYALKRSLTAHLEIHKGTERYTCFICNKMYLRKLNLKRHIQIHSEIKEH